ncbi:MAG: ABC transporter ATP-binding protein [Bacteroidales bacterium]|nr:ABC transporter ATP-binding protein [Candidatus Cryptobacteroides equifaecalis]
MDGQTAIKVEGICKSFKETKALQDINLEIKHGEIFGLIGPDGAGKTSLFRILTTLSLADSGKASVNGLDVVDGYAGIRRSIGYMPGHFALYQDLSVEENLNFYATVFGTTVAENYDTIKDIYSQIEMFKDRKARDLSGGMKQKLALCCALVHKPDVLFLDEPTTGVDAVSRKEFWAMLGRIKDSGVTIMVSTPYMDEASLCDRIALILAGKIIDKGTPADIISRYPHRLFAIRGGNMFRILKELKVHEGIIRCSSFGCECHVAVTDNGPDASSLLDILEKSGMQGCRVEAIQAGIEDCFIGLS